MRPSEGDRKRPGGPRLFHHARTVRSRHLRTRWASPGAEPARAWALDSSLQSVRSRVCGFPASVVAALQLLQGADRGAFPRDSPKDLKGTRRRHGLRQPLNAALACCRSFSSVLLGPPPFSPPQPSWRPTLPLQSPAHTPTEHTRVLGHAHLGTCRAHSTPGWPWS